MIIILLFIEKKNEISNKREFGYHQKYILASELFLENKETE